mgnify:CR=1 FL=1
MKLQNKHIAYIGLALLPNLILMFLIFFKDELKTAIGEAEMKTIGLFLQTFSIIIVIFGGWFLSKSFRVKSRLRFWSISMFMAAIPFFYNLFFNIHI